jgi:hypothetical protein
MRTVLLLVLAALAGVLAASDWLPAGIHKGLTDEGGKHRFTVVVPAAAADGKEAPVVFVLPGYTGLLDPYPWQPWAERRGCLVVALDDGLVHAEGGSAGNAYANVNAVLAHFADTIAAAGKRVQMQPYARIAVADRMMAPFATQFAKAQGEALSGLLFTRPWSVSEAAIAELPGHLATFVLVGQDDAASERTFLEVRSRLRNAGFAARSAYVEGGKANDWVPQGGCDIAVDHLLDLALLTHPKQSPIKRLANQEAMIARGQALAALADQPCYDQLWWMLTVPSVPGMEKQKKPMEGLANRWIEAGIGVAKAKETGDIVEAHEFLSAVAKRPQAKLADAAHNKSLLAELARLRKDKRIKAEIVAADSLANISSMLEDDATTAKLKICLKQLEELVAQHPATHAGKEAAKLLEKVRAALR